MAGKKTSAILKQTNCDKNSRALKHRINNNKKSALKCNNNKDVSDYAGSPGKMEMNVSLNSISQQNLTNNERTLMPWAFKGKQNKSKPEASSISSDSHSTIFQDIEARYAALKSHIYNTSKCCVSEKITNTKNIDVESCTISSNNPPSEVKAHLECRKRKLDAHQFDSINLDSDIKKEELEDELQRTPLSKCHAKRLLCETLQFICEENKDAITISESTNGAIFKQKFEDLHDEYKSVTEISQPTQKELNSKFKKDRLKYSTVKSNLQLLKKSGSSEDVKKVKFNCQDITKKQSLEFKQIEDRLCQSNTNFIHENNEPSPFSEKVPLKDIDEINEMKSIYHTSEMEDLKQNSIIPHNVIKSFIKCKIKDSTSVDICQVLSKYCTDKLIEVVQSAIKYKDLWGREKLTISDFKKSIFFCEEESLPNLPYLSMNAQKKKEKNVNTATYKLNAKDFLLPNPNILINADWTSNNNPLSKSISELSVELKTYFNLITESLLSLNEELYSTVLNDLQTNQNILNLVPYFVTFLSSKIDKLQCDCPRLMVLLKAMQSLLSNPCLYFGHDSYFNIMTHSLLKCLLDPLEHVNRNWDYCLLRDTAANLLAQILKRSNSRKLWFEVVFNLESAFCDLEKPFISHYGAVVALNSIGVSAISIVIPPYIDKYYEHLNSVKSTDHQNRYDACAVRGQLINSYYHLICHYLKYEFTEYHSNRFHDFSSQYYSGDFVKNVKVFPLIQRIPFAEYFGDVLVHHFPLLNFISRPRNCKRKKIKSTVRNVDATKTVLNSSSRVDIPREKEFIELKVSKEKHLSDVSTCDKSVSKLTHLVFDFEPFKSRTITFGKIWQKL